MKIASLLAAASTATIALAAQPAGAVEFKAGEATITLNSTITLGASMRVDDPSCNLTGDPTSYGCGGAAATGAWASGDDGDLNYGAGDVYSFNLKGTHDLFAALPDDWSGFARGSWIYDFVADDTDRTELSDSAYDRVGRDIQLLDLWVGKDFVVGEQRGRIRVGNQVVNWGEGLFFLGGVSTSAAIDYQRLTVPGTQLKEGLLPSPVVNVKTTIADGLSFEGYYQYGWRANKYPPIGTYWGTNDTYGFGRRSVYTVDTTNFNAGGYDAATILRMQGYEGRLSESDLARVNSELAAGVYAFDPVIHSFGIPVLEDAEPRDNGQFGLSFRWSPDFVTADLGFYFVNYHAKEPVLTNLAVGALQYSYPEDRQMLGTSISFPLGDWAIGAELSYRPNEPIPLSGCYYAGGPADANTNGVTGIDCPMWAETEKYQLNINGLLNMGGADYAGFLDLVGADSAVIAAELLAVAYPDLKTDGPFSRTIDGVDVFQMLSPGYATWLQFDPALGYDTVRSVGSKLSVGYVVDFNLTYDSSIIPGWQVIPGVTFQHAAYGTTPNYGVTLSENAMSANAYITFIKNPGTWQAGINYAMFFGAHNDGQPTQLVEDRDFVGIYVSHSF